MRALFPGYYRPTAQEFADMWRNAVFAVDANVLLLFYRTKPDTREQLFATLERIGDRIWLPHQAAYEYHENRLNVILDQAKAFDTIRKDLCTWLNTTPGQMQKYTPHPTIDLSRLTAIAKEAHKQMLAAVDEARSNHVDISKEDPILDRITALFDAKVGPPYTEEQQSEIYKKADKRFAQKKPPGYKDAEKDGTNTYGDLVLWFQILAHAKQEQKPLIFVTDDKKEDWWRRNKKGETVGPRPELIQEMRNHASVPFYMYTSDQFMVHAEKFFQLQHRQAAIEELREIRQQHEEEQRLYQETRLTNVALPAAALAVERGQHELAHLIALGVLRAAARPHALYTQLEEIQKSLSAARPNWLRAIDGIQKSLDAYDTSTRHAGIEMAKALAAFPQPDLSGQMLQILSQPTVLQSLPTILDHLEQRAVRPYLPEPEKSSEEGATTEGTDDPPDSSPTRVEGGGAKDEEPE